MLPWTALRENVRPSRDLRFKGRTPSLPSRAAGVFFFDRTQSLRKSPDR